MILDLENNKINDIEFKDIDINEQIIVENRKVKKVLKQCKKCCKKRIVIKIEQERGKRNVEEDLCPYCGYSNESSMSWKFISYKNI